MGNEDEKSGLERQIEENLRRVYQQSIEEDVPDRFKDLLSKLKAQDGQHSKESSSQ